MPDQSGDHPRDTMRGRADRSTWKLWLLLGADRRRIAAGIAAFFWVSIVALGVAHPTDAWTLLDEGDPIETLFQAYVTALITGVTLVLTLNQLVLSQELGAVGDQRERMEGALEFRRDVSDVVDEPVSPAEPSAFLRSLLTASADRADALEDALEGADDEVRSSFDDLLNAIRDNASQVSDRLADAQFGSFDVLFAALDFNYSWKIVALKRARAEHAAILPADAEDAVADLLDVLELFGPAREHFKTLYFQWELVSLSRSILYAAVPALAVTSAVLLFFDAPAFAGSTLGLSDALLVVATASTISLVPFAILLSYVLRIGTVAKRTLSIGPFILRETDESVEEE